MEVPGAILYWLQARSFYTIAELADHYKRCCMASDYCMEGVASL